MLDVALFMSNATRLKVVLEQGPSSQYYATLIALISVSLLLQVVIGILLVVIGKPSRQSLSALVPPGGGKGPSIHTKLSSHLLTEPVLYPTVRARPVLSPHIPSMGTH